MQQKRERIEELNRLITNLKVAAENPSDWETVAISYLDETGHQRTVSSSVGNRTETLVQFAAQERDALITSLQADLRQLQGQAGQNGIQNGDKTEREVDAETACIREMMQHAGL